MSVPITGLSGSVEMDSLLADVFSWSITRTSDNQTYASSSTAGWKKTLAGQKGWTLTMSVANPDGSLEFGFEIGDSVAFVGTSVTGKYASGTAVIDTIEPEVDIEGATVVRSTVTATGDGELSYTG